MLESAKKVDIGLAQQLAAIQSFELQMTESEMLRKNAVGELRGLLRRPSSPSPPPGRKKYSRKKLPDSQARTQSMDEHSPSDNSPLGPLQSRLRDLEA